MHKDFLSILDLSISDIEDIFKMSDTLRISKGKVLEGKILALLFEKASTRTRTSFEAAMLHLGGHVIYLESKTMQISRGETLADTARVLDKYVDIIAARMYRHEDLKELAINSSVPVINALTDIEHPCQALSDVYTISNIKKRTKGINFAFIGDIASNTANSLMVACAMVGMNVRLVGPNECIPNMEYVDAARKYGRVDVFSDIPEGLNNADVIYTDTFVSMGQESSAKERVKMFKDYQLNAKAMSYAKEDAIAMHCLPAHRGEEISADVIDGKQSVVWEQARNKMVVEAGILLFFAGRHNDREK
jgi:ornithine carbamoyltransferase